MHGDDNDFVGGFVRHILYKKRIQFVVELKFQICHY